MRHALQDGVLFTRYLPDLAFGYGYPFFNYRAALSYYLTLVLHLAGLALPFALNIVYVLSILGSPVRSSGGHRRRRRLCLRPLPIPRRSAPLQRP
jgi:hypothetical protein